MMKVNHIVSPVWQEGCIMNPTLTFTEMMFGCRLSAMSTCAHSRATPTATATRTRHLTRPTLCTTPQTSAVSPFPTTPSHSPPDSAGGFSIVAMLCLVGRAPAGHCTAMQRCPFVCAYVCRLQMCIAGFRCLGCCSETQTDLDTSARWFTPSCLYPTSVPWDCCYHMSCQSWCLSSVSSCSCENGQCAAQRCTPSC